MTTAPNLEREYTADDLLELEDGGRYELDDGRLVELDLAYESQAIAALIIVELGIYLRNNPIGHVAASEAGLAIFDTPRKLRRADVSFIRDDRLPRGDLPGGNLRIPPDLVVEVISPHDNAGYVENKVTEYLGAGVRLIWLVYPYTRSVTIISSDGDSRRLTEHAEIDGGDVLPGFRVPVSSFFPVRNAAAEGEEPAPE